MKYFKLKPGENKIRILPPKKSHFSNKDFSSLVNCEGVSCRYCYEGFLVDIAFNEHNFRSARREGAD